MKPDTALRLIAVLSWMSYAKLPAKRVRYSDETDYYLSIELQNDGLEVSYEDPDERATVVVTSDTNFFSLSRFEAVYDSSYRFRFEASSSTVRVEDLNNSIRYAVQVSGSSVSIKADNASDALQYQVS